MDFSKGVIPIQKDKTGVRVSASFLMKEIFSAIGFLFVLLFTARGILLISAFLTGGRNGAALLSTLKQSHYPALDAVLMVFCMLIIVHAVIGVISAIKTDYKFKGLFRQRALFTLQIVSAVGAYFVVHLLTRPSANAAAHSFFSWVAAALISFLGAFHFANGFSNACITLGISVSERSRTVVKALSWLIAAISALQIAALLS